MKCLVAILLVCLAAPLPSAASASDHVAIKPAADGTLAFRVPSLGLGCRYNPALAIHKDWPGEREAALACGRKTPVNQRFVISYTGRARIEAGRGGLDCCRGGPALTPGREVNFHSIFACRIEGETLHCRRADGPGFTVDDRGGRIR